MEEKKTILVVEDDEDSRHALCSLLEKLGHTTLSFSRSTEVMSNITGKTIDLALLDIMMPGMNGYELLQQLRASPEFGTLPVFMVTAKDAESEALEGYRYGADYYIMKPYTARQLEFSLQLYLKSATKR